MECRIQKSILTPKDPNGCLIDILTGKRVLDGDWKVEIGEPIFEYSDYLEIDPKMQREMSKDVSKRELDKLLRDL